MRQARSRASQIDRGRSQARAVVRPVTALHRSIGNRGVRALVNKYSEHGLAKPFARSPLRAAVNEAVRAPGEKLSDPSSINVARRMGIDPKQVSVHKKPSEQKGAAAMNAAAYSVGKHVVFGPGSFSPGTAKGNALLAHELVHARSQRFAASPGVPNRIAGPNEESEAKVLSSSLRAHAPAAAPIALAMHPAEKIAHHALKWLSRRTMNTLTKHIQRHTRRILGRAVHAIFRHPKKIKQMVATSVEEALVLIRRNSARSATEVLEEGGLRVFMQTTPTPGKVRWVVERTFRDAIGTAGERILRIVLDQSGRVVTAFPVDRFLAIGLGVGALQVFGERSAQASEEMDASVKRQAKRDEQNASLSWEDFIPFIGDVFGGSLNSGESEMILQDRLMMERFDALIAEIELSEKRTLDKVERAQLREIYLLSLTMSSLLDSGELSEE